MNQFIGSKAPNFVAKAVMPDNRFDDAFNLKDYLAGSVGILFFYPLNFTFVCPSEIIAFNNRLGEFSSRGAKVIGISVDSHFSHLAYKETPTTRGGIGNIKFPLVSDINKTISNNYNVLNADGVAFRGTFLIDQDFNIRHYLVNDLPLGRNVDEAIRMIDALDFFQKNGQVCPAGWNKGDSGMSPTQGGVSDYLASNADKL